MIRMTLAPLLMAGLFLFLPFEGIVMGAELSVETSVDRASVRMGERITLSVKVQGAVAGSLPAPSVPSHDGLDLVGVPFQSSSFSWINGQVSASKTINYILLPQAPGTFLIGPATVTYDGGTASSQPIQVVVEKGAERPAPPGGGGGTETPAGLSGDPQGRIMVSAGLSQNRIYAGEGVLYTFSFFHKVRLWENPRFEPPPFTHFWVEELPSGKGGREVVVRGERYLRDDVKRVLFPTREGFVTVGAASLEAQIDPFSRPVLLKTDPLELEVLSLPDEPDDFSGAVGSFTLSAKADRLKGKEGEPVIVRVSIAGMGNLRGLAPPRMGETDAFRGYEPKDSVEVSTLNDVISGTKTFEYLFIPLKSGSLTLPPFSYTFFDPAEERYKTVTTKALAFSIEPGEKGLVFGGASAAGTGLGEEKERLRPIRRKSDLGSDTPSDYLLGWPLFILLLPPLLWGLLAFARSRSSRDGGTKGLKGALAALKGAERLIGGGESKAFFAETAGVLEDYLTERLGTAPGLTSREELVLALAQAGCPVELKERVEKALAKAEMGRFSPTRYGHDEMEAFYRETTEIVQACEKIDFKKEGR